MTWIHFGKKTPDMRTGPTTLRSDDRGASNTVHYVLSLGMATVLFVGLLLAAGNLVDSQRDRAVADELSIVGNRLASDIVAVDGLVDGTDGVTVNDASLSPALPDTISGEDYTVTVSQTQLAPDRYKVTLTLRVSDLNVAETVTTTTTHPVETDTYNGGDLVVRYENSKVVIANG